MRQYLIIILSVFFFTDGISQKAKGIAIVHVNVINVMQPNPLLEDQTVLIVNNKISSVKNSKNSKVPPGFTVIDGKDKFLMPGLCDLNLRLVDYRAETLPTLVKTGVTAVRDISGDSTRADQWRKEIKEGKMIGPRIFRADTLIATAVPQKSLQDRLLSLVKGGNTALQAIKAVTIKAAVYMKVEKEIGSIDPGKTANVILLDANPLKDIANIKKISRVILNGKVVN